ncbi:amidophosphoribosyltransferase [Sugiyamaella lignohabitans]|uniref:amidophosphoribosyltransferase n=1 Tax=Sugiyamaella lignohabitans TaxID=796027 RepID=A0A167FB25_9ASCO|nr:amidophosphoribosyltransferase [Sugiyamaella lignohabitans]ANB15055.1 amidophosphoribosyltransferase [Sugiyamaella lignohabitans]
MSGRVASFCGRMPPAAGAPPQTLVATASQELLGLRRYDSSVARGAVGVWGAAPAAGGRSSVDVRLLTELRCGVIGLLLADPMGIASAELLEGTHYLQHRGQDAAGIITSGPGGRLYMCKGNGMARDVFTQSKMNGLVGNMGIGHLRYPTAGGFANSEAQPFYVNSPYGLVLSHNGNLVNAPALKKYLDEDVHRHINTDSDSELLLNVFASKLQETNKVRINDKDIFTALKGVYEMVRGAYACAGMLAGYGIIGFRDPHGIRPLVLGSRTRKDGKKDYMLASESIALDAMGFKEWFDIKPGQAVIIDKHNMTPVLQQIVPAEAYTPDIFEYVYFARPDSVMDGISVYRSRLAMGDSLAKNIIKRYGGLDKVKEAIDVVIPVPDTSRHSALQAAVTLDLPYREGFIKNRYVGRTFIMPNQQERRSSVRRKLNAMSLEFSGRNVLLVDDSIVRGTTSKEIVQMAKEAGAKKVFFASCAPAIRHNHIYGIDLADTKALVAYDRDEESISKEIGADGVFYQDLDDLIAACNESSHSGAHQVNVEGYEVGVFTGNYITGVEESYLSYLEEIRGKNQRLKELGDRADTAVSQVLGEAKAEVDIGLYNQGD